MTKHLTLLLLIGFVFWSCEEEVEENTNPYIGVKTEKVSSYDYLETKFGKDIYETLPKNISITTYNQNGQKIKIISYDSNGKEKDISKWGAYGITRYFYNASGNMIQKQKEYLNGKLYKKYVYEYTSFDSMRVSSILDSNNKVQKTTESIFDKLNRYVEDNEYDSDGLLSYQTKYYYKGDQNYHYKADGASSDGKNKFQTKFHYTFFDEDSTQIKTKEYIVQQEQRNRVIFKKYDRFGKVLEKRINETFIETDESVDNQFFKYDSIGKLIEKFEFYESPYDTTKNKIIHEFEYYND